MTVFAAVQMVSGASVEANLRVVERQVADAAFLGAKVIVLPENFALMGHAERDKLDIVEQYGSGPIQTLVSTLAERHGAWIVAGTLPLRGAMPGKVRAACLVYDATGRCVGRYDKCHLFDVNIPGRDENYRESATIEPGANSVVVETPFGKLGLSVCYDLRFPELYRLMVDRGAEIFLVPSAFTANTGQAHWELLLRARAIENLCYVVAPNQGGRHANGRMTFGNSMIIDPWGAILARGGAGEAIVSGSIDLAKLHDVRRQFPVLGHRRFGHPGPMEK